jgi:hypothetical protein
MTYIRLDDHFPQHRKILALDDAAFALHVRAICYSSTQLSDGEIPSNALSLLTRNRRPQGLIAQLVEADLWQSTLTGWRIHDYLDWQESSEAVWSKRAAARQRMQRLRSPDVRTNNERSSQEVREQETETTRTTETTTTTAGSTPSSPAPQDDHDFATFWNTYPTRHGKRLGKDKARIIWCRLPESKRQLALRGAVHYRTECDSGTLAKDAFRWLRDDEWVDWQEAPVITPATSNGNGHHPQHPTNRENLLAAMREDGLIP